MATYECRAGPPAMPQGVFGGVQPAPTAENHDDTRIALTKAASDGDYAKCEEIIRGGAALLMPHHTRREASPLMGAAMNGHADICGLLVRSGARVNWGNHGGFTALHYAGTRGDCVVIRRLLVLGADIHAVTRFGKYPYHVAFNNGHFEAAKLLRYYAPWVGHLAKWRRAVDAKRDAGRVFRAAAEGRPMELAKRLKLGKLAGGLEIKGEVEDGAGGTRVVRPLEAARLGGHDECVAMLQAAGSST